MSYNKRSRSDFDSSIDDLFLGSSQESFTLDNFLVNCIHPSVICFNNFLANKLSSSNDTYSHKSFMNNYYFIDENQYELFLEMLCNASSHQSFEFIESPSYLFPAVFRFNFDSHYTEQLISVIVSNLYKHLKSLLKLDILSNYDQCVLVKKKNNPKLFYIFFPKIILFKRLFFLTRQLFLNDLIVSEGFQELCLEDTADNAFSDIVEFPVISNKTLYDFFVFNGLGERIMDNSFFDNSSSILIAKFLSIRLSKLCEVPPLSVFGDVSLDIDQFDIYNLSFIRQMVELIDPSKVNPIDIAWALINLKLNCDCFHIISKFSNCLEFHQWEFMKMNPCPSKTNLGLSTLIYFASIHSNNSFRNIMFDNIWIFVKYACDKYVSFNWDEKKNDNGNMEMVLRTKFQLFDSICFYLATIAKVMYGHIFVCSNIIRKQWFYFNGVNWVKSNRAVHLSKLFTNDFYSLFNYWSVHFSRQHTPNDLVIIGKSYSKACSDFASFLRNPLKKKLLIDVCAEVFYWDFQHILNVNLKSENFHETLDTNVFLIGLANGVYDLSSNLFRSSKPDDFVHLSTKNSFLLYNWDQPIIIEIMDFLKKVFPDQIIRNYVLKLFASFMDGNIDEQFFIFTGTGSNGKSKLVELFQLSLGDYCGTLPVSLITGKRTPSASATPELARMKGKRLGILHESNVTDVINLGLIKAISGGDNMYTRALHSDPIEFRPTFQLLLLCNDKPKRIDSYDYATWRRIIVITFRSSFLDIPDPNNPFHFKKDKYLHTKLPLWKEAFFWILTQHYEELRNHGNPIPPEIVADTQQYRDSNDYIQIFIREHIERTEFPNDIIYLNDVFSKFKTFYFNFYQENSRIKFDDFTDIIVSKLGSLVSFQHKQKGWTNFIFL